MYQFLSRPDRHFSRCGDLRCTAVERHIPGAPAFMRGLRALFVSDVHVLHRTPEAALDALMARIADARPDLILLGGDYADEPTPCRRFFDHMKRVSVPLGCYGVVGNNDREAFPDLDDLRRVMSAAGARLLVNEAQTLPLPGGQLIVAGLDEYRRGQPNPAGLYPAQPDAGHYRLLLSHYPRAVSPMPDLMLSGHTHGGQFNLLGVTPYSVGFERLLAHRRASRFIAGMHEWDGGRMFVSKGIGASKLPLRVGVRPEIDLLIFD